MMPEYQGNLADWLDHWWDEHPPHAEITKTGRFTYHIIITHGLTTYGPVFGGVQIGWHRIGRRRAEAKARRELDRYKRTMATTPVQEVT